MMKLTALVLSLVGLLGNGSAQFVQDGQCLDIALVENFDADQFVGTWYEIRRSASPTPGACSTVEINRSTDSYTFTFNDVNRNLAKRAHGVATLEDGSAKYNLNLDNEDTDFWILSTDYKSYALAYSCVNISPSLRSVSFWQLSRTPITNQDLPELSNTLNRLGIDATDLETVDFSSQSCYVSPISRQILPGQCDPNPEAVPNFDVARFTGVWHEIASYPSQNALGRCNKAQYTSQDGNVNVVNSQVVDQRLEEIIGTATVNSTDGSGLLWVILEVIPGAGVFAEQPLAILGTDYENWAVSYTCTNMDNDTKQVFSWMLSRDKVMSETSQLAVDAIVAAHPDLSYDIFQNADHSYEACFYYPEVDPSRPVEFNGGCGDLNIQGMPNFDAVRYLGLWHNIESYPTPSQIGTCNNANYSLNPAGYVDVFNTEVLNQTLDTIEGIAEVVSPEGFGELLVTFIFNIEGIPFASQYNYTILDTDYESYAFVMSCSQSGDGQRKQIFSWKLSRTKQLTENARNNIANIVATVPVLDERYFVPRDQSPEACFYFPEVQEGVVTEFPGLCENIEVVNNFDLAQFAGTWYEIQAYPKEQQSGQCINHQFTTGTGNTLNLQSSSVYDRFREITSSVLSYSSPDNSARMTITLVNGIEIPFWITAINYTDWALAYSCVNIADDFRRVFSWKLSRTPQLSDAANTAINNAMADVQVMDDRYHQIIDQSETACAFIAELTPGDPVIMPGTCNLTIPVLTNFDAARYLGRWYVIESYPSEFQDGECNQATYSLDTDGSVVAYNTQVKNQTFDEQIGRATVMDSDDGSAKLLVTFPGAPAPIEYWILDTDYDSYALVYSCVDLINDLRQVFSWKLGREKSLSDNAVNAINQGVGRVDELNHRYYKVGDNSDEACFYWPESTPGQAPIFRGQCDEDIAVVQNFDVARYLGRWYDIESYPQAFQDGSCASALYSLADSGVVDVYNTQVTNQRLDTTNGTAVLATDDGSAKLVVTFPIPGAPITISTDYWVLATDYEGYAFVYSCQNVDTESRRVSTWKLSREKQLSVAAITQINSIMDTIQVLDERYYLPQDQSEDGCFFFPEPQPGVVVEFPGQCPDDIPVVTNFDLEQFAGTWYEIQAYPKEQQSGQCINHQFTTGTDNTLNLESSSVYDRFREITSSVLSYSSPDNSARMTITLVNGIEIPFWITAINYTDWALAYSCVNIADDFRRVFSWKLSRTPQLSDAANTAINNAMADVQVMDDRYHQIIDQSETACAFIAELTPGDPVIMPGTCNLTIPVLTNFDAARYLGRWYVIESYPSEFQDGECNQATYSLDTDGSVVAYNTQVKNQTFDEQIGRATVMDSDDGSAKLLVTFPGAPAPIEYWILDTDYDSYALVYSCVNLINDLRQVFSWKLGREKSLSDNAVNAINQVVGRVDELNHRFYKVGDNSDEACFYWPESTPGQAPIFRGQCDENIAVVQNFDVARYLGRWYDIESYPQAFQDGSCASALYSLADSGVVDVYNTQVTNQRLDTTNGTAVLATDDGSAKLVVTFPIPGAPITISTDYWVLATDYEGYAFVYSCQNVDTESRRVSTWKLSREKQLSVAAITQINSIMDTIQVLDERYYLPQDQSEDGCFFFPEPQPGVVVEFPGQCPDDIPVVTNFDLEQFAGTWYEIQAYPKEQQSGQCINHQFTTGTDNTLNLESSSVYDRFREITSSVLSYSSPDNSARMTITLVNGIEIPFWITAINYTDWALAYSCVNIADDFRRVFSWKLSRTPQLSDAANTAINNAMADVQVIDDRYHQIIDQSETACAFIAELTPGDPVIMPGTCNLTIPVLTNFDAARYLGRWYVIESYPSEFQDGECNQATYSLDTDGSVVAYNTQVKNQTFDEQIGRATVMDSDDGSAKLLVTFPGAPAPIEYWILDTDYDSYALVYSCVNLINDLRQVFSWKLGREKSLSDNAVNAINQVVGRVDELNHRFYKVGDNSDEACFYWPESTPGQAPIFRGQCDENIAVVQNFDVARYLGRWYDIESYPQAFQDGSCASALYSLADSGVVDVYNTQVTNQRLDTTNGTAVLATDDGSAKLVVTFPIPGAPITISTDYWVLATDYEGYAFVYSCQNVDTESRRVSTWKLSREKQLSVAAITQINSIMDTIQVLDERYYLPQDQSEDGCFFFPEPQPGVVVEFPGQCPDDIPVVTNFDLEQFQGIWHEIQAYPKDEQTGQCISHQFTTGTGNTLNLQTSSVTGQLLETSNSVLAFNSTDSSAKMTITNTEGIIIPYWIVDTDYTNYGLAYSCVNINSDSRRVYSWKLSRSRQLSADANNAINNAMANIQVLDNVYYENIAQSNDACFFTPQPAPGVPALFPGTCDESHPVVTNFDAGRYLGRWNLIESYPTVFQEGECNQATYTLQDDGSVLVYNTQVMNQTLDEMTGRATVIPSNDSSGKLEVTFPNAPTIEYWIMATDYDSYSLVYSCINVHEYRRQVWSWKLSRDKTLSNIAIAAMDQVINEIEVLDNIFYERVDTSDEACFYYPELILEQAPIFRGICNENINVVQNFDIERYLGTWYDVESYPQAFQNGTCATAVYTAGNGGVVNVFNTQVVNERLDTSNGTAVSVATDGSAKLEVTFPVAGTDLTFTTPYWVLATDYDSYAFLYSCSNVDSESRRVTSWKMSRTKTLTQQAITTISAIIEGIDVLDDRYYIEKGQSDADCFYYPEFDNLPASSIELPGPCNESIQAQPNFDAGAYTGRWFEMTRYPTGDQFAECVRATYSLGDGGVVDVYNTQVSNQQLLVQEGTAVVASTDGSGLLDVILTTEAGTFIANYYVLLTDYLNYALVYSCRNSTNGNRVISSWKLSRARTGISDEAEALMSNIIDNTQGLLQDYYIPTSQSDDDCFYIPEVDASDDVRYRGQCENITGVQNFNIERYLGWWHEIERYPTSAPTGECTSSQFESSGNQYLVVDTSVTDQNGQIDTSVVTANTNGLLRRTLSNGQVIDTWVLATDYETYSLLYSCENIDDEYRQVWSAKHSKSRQLTPAAQNAMAPVINNNQVLYPQFYLEVDQGSDACFYFPEADGRPVILDGRCDGNIPVVQNFDAGEYTGTWYHIERYPQRIEPGTECTGARYTLDESTGIVTVLNWEVIDGELDTTEGNATITSTDGSAKWEVVLPNKGEGDEDTVTQSLYVLSTDYSSYSLVYSCEEINEFQRQLGVLKLSRTRTMPAAGNNAINAYIATRPEIDQRYFIEINHYEDCLEPSSAGVYFKSSFVVLLVCVLAQLLF